MMAPAMVVTALIMAGGTGERFKGAAPKQLAPIDGRAMIAWSARVLAESPRIDALIVVTAAGTEKEVRASLPAEAARKVRAVIAGGETRQESAFNGLKGLPRGTTHVLIHDAARPCLSGSLRDRVLDALSAHDAVVPAVPATDTLIREEDGRVDAVLDRVYVSGVQTPQAFRADLILRAHREAAARGFKSSDDGSLVLALKEPVFTVAGERTNIKVTFAEDLRLAEVILQNGVAA
jgi:2-C-methyl-D-erythritol 4-phosphate cytidylyltransferase